MNTPEVADELFHGTAKVLVPWQQSSRLKHQPLYDTDAVRALLTGPQHVVPIDPTELRATQPFITRAGVAYYLTRVYELTGTTYADQHSRANRFPIISTSPNGQRVILSGHHRCAAALLRGQPVWARSTPGMKSSGYRSATAALHIGEVSPTGMSWPWR